MRYVAIQNINRGEFEYSRTYYISVIQNHIEYILSIKIYSMKINYLQLIRFNTVKRIYSMQIFLAKCLDRKESYSSMCRSLGSHQGAVALI